MSIYIHRSKNGLLVRAEAFGEINREMMENACLQIVQKHGHRRQLRVLTDVRAATVAMSARDNVQFAQFLAKLFKGRNVRIAVLHGRGHNPMASTDRAAQGAGLLIQQFTSELGASRWLEAPGEHTAPA